MSILVQRITIWKHITEHFAFTVHDGCGFVPISINTHYTHTHTKHTHTKHTHTKHTHTKHH